MEVINYKYIFEYLKKYSKYIIIDIIDINIIIKK